MDPFNIVVPPASGSPTPLSRSRRNPTDSPELRLMEHLETERPLSRVCQTDGERLLLAHWRNAILKPLKILVSPPAFIQAVAYVEQLLISLQKEDAGIAMTTFNNTVDAEATAVRMKQGGLVEQEGGQPPAEEVITCIRAIRPSLRALFSEQNISVSQLPTNTLELQQLLGDGGFGVVFKVLCELTGVRRALKVVLGRHDPEGRLSTEAQIGLGGESGLVRCFGKWNPGPETLDTIAVEPSPEGKIARAILRIRCAKNPEGTGSSDIQFLEMELVEGQNLHQAFHAASTVMEELQTAYTKGEWKALAGSLLMGRGKREMERLNQVRLQGGTFGEMSDDTGLSNPTEREMLTKAVWNIRAYAIARIVRDSAEILHTQLHKNGWVHCDIKPENIMIRSDGSIVIIDPGIAEPIGQMQTRSPDDILGTLCYISPEQAASRPAAPSFADDTWALMIMLFELLTPREEHPFKVKLPQSERQRLTPEQRKRKEDEATLRLIRGPMKANIRNHFNRGDLRLPPQELLEVLDRGLQKKSGLFRRRYQDMKEVTEALDKFLEKA